MSRSFARFAKLFNVFSSDNYSPSSPSIEMMYYSTLATIIVSGIFGHCTYAIGTAETKFIKIKHKYTFDRNGFTEFMIIDENDKHYNVNNSVWYWKWDSIEDGNKIKTSAEQDEKIAIKYYGWRGPLFGMFPNIIMSRQDQVLSSISGSECRKIEYNFHKEKEQELTNQEN